MHALKRGVVRRTYSTAKLSPATAERLRRRRERERARQVARAETTATIEAARRGENLIFVGHHSNLLAVLNADEP